MKVRRLIWTLAGMFLLAGLKGQGIQDSLFHITQVRVVHRRLFVPEEAGLKISHVDSTVLQAKASASLSELLSENTPVFIKSEGRGAMATASFRGSDASHTQVSWNGMAINSPMLGMVDFSLIPVYLIDELSLHHGAASLTERGGGLGGVIRMENAPDWSAGPGLKYIQGIGSYSTFDEYLQARLGGKKFRSVSRIYHMQSANDYTFINRSIGELDPESGEIINPLDTNSNAAYKRYGLQQEFYFRPDSKQRISLVYWGQYSDRSIPWPTSYEGPDNANLNRQQQADHRLAATWKYYLEGGRLLLRSAYSSNEMDYQQYRQVPGLGEYSDVASFSRENSFYNQLAFRKKLGHGFATELKADVNHYMVSTRDTVSMIAYQVDRTEFSFFASLSKSFFQRVNLNLMLRQEIVDGEALPLIPFLGMDIRILEDKDFFFKASVSRNYHMPSLNDLYWQPNGNPDLLPEEGFNIEAGLEHRFLRKKFSLETGLSAYRNDVSNWIMWVPGANTMMEPVNIKRVLSGGLELDLKARGILGWLSYGVSGNYAWTRALNYGDPMVWGDASYGKQLVYIPEHSANLMLSLGVERVSLSYQYNYYSERFTTSSNELTRRDWLYPYFMNDLGLGYSLPLEKVKLSAEIKVYNLFNESYRSVLYRPMPGRNYMLVIRMEL